MKPLEKNIKYKGGKVSDDGNGVFIMKCPICFEIMTAEEDCYHCGNCGNVENL